MPDELDIETALEVKAVHYLQGGFAPCGIEGTPGDWPEGHYWVACWRDVTCPACLSLKPVEGIPHG